LIRNCLHPRAKVTEYSGGARISKTRGTKLRLLAQNIANESRFSKSRAKSFKFRRNLVPERRSDPHCSRSETPNQKIPIQTKKKIKSIEEKQEIEGNGEKTLKLYWRFKQIRIRPRETRLRSDLKERESQSPKLQIKGGLNPN